MLKIIFAYLCYLNVASLTTLQYFRLSYRYKTVLGIIPYGTVPTLEIYRHELQYKLTVAAVVMACLGTDVIDYVCSLCISEQAEYLVFYLINKIYWAFKILWIYIYITGIVSIIFYHHQLMLITDKMDVEHANFLLCSYRLQFLWHSFVFLFANACWSEEHRLNKNYYELLMYERGFDF